jgi:putative flippase GtrA
VDLTPTALLAHARSDAGRRALRYSATSVVGVIGSLILLQIFHILVGWTAVWSNFTAACLMSIPVFLLNKYWVWGKSGRAHIRREVLPFWVFTVAGWGLSTLTVMLADQNTESGTLLNRVAVSAASIGGFGILWVLKYMFLDKIMFGPHHHTPYDEDIEIEEAGGEPDLAPVDHHDRPGIDERVDEPSASATKP